MTVGKVGQKFNELYFGKAAAETEVERNPERFFQTYFDYWNVARKVRERDFFLVLGPKGSGKSAVGAYARLTMVNRYGQESTFAATLDMNSIGPGVTPLSSITTKLVTEANSGTTDSAWTLFIALRILALLRADQSCSLSRDPKVARLYAQLESAGLIEGDFPTVLRRIRENSLSFSFKGVGIGSKSHPTDEVSAGLLGNSLVELIRGAESENKFLLTLDGLDKIVGDNAAYWSTLAALLRVGNDLHHRLNTARADITLLIMCRTDIFRRIQFADADKIQADSSLYVDWDSESTKPYDSPLWDYLARKACMPSADNLLAFLPPNVRVGESTKKEIPTAKYLIDFTRSTPREMSLLMKQIQDAVPVGGSITAERVRIGADRFARRDLLSVVSAEATGVLESAIRDRLEGIIASLPCAFGLTNKEVAAALTSNGLDADMTGTLCEFLFLAGLIGNVDANSGYIHFYHRRDTARFNRTGPWVLHKALMYAFNLPYSKARQVRD